MGRHALHHWSGSLLCSFGLYLAQKEFDVLCLVNLRDPQEGLGCLDNTALRKLSDSLNIPMFTPPSGAENVKLDIRDLFALVNQKYSVQSVILNTFEHDNRMQAVKQKYEELSFHVQNLLQGQKPEEIFEKCMHLGFSAHIFSVNEKCLNRSYLGVPLTMEMIEKFKENNIHPFGLNGEFETLCTNGPNFKYNVSLNFGDVHYKNGLWYRDIMIG